MFSVVSLCVHGEFLPWILIFNVSLLASAEFARLAKSLCDVHKKYRSSKRNKKFSSKN